MGSIYEQKGTSGSRESPTPGRSSSKRWLLAGRCITSKEMMAEKKPKIKREPGKIKQLLQVYKLTAKADKNFVPLGILSFVGPKANGLFPLSCSLCF
jgi:hypothetical protein